MEKERKNGIDMLNGPLVSKILMFALPLALSSILQQLFNSVDVAVVGNFASSHAQAAVGCNGALINLLLNLFLGISVGANVVIANYIGGNQMHKIQNAVHTAIVMALISGVFLLVVGQVIARPVLQLMDTPEDIMEQAVLYLRIYFFGMPFILLYDFGASILRSMGDTKRPLYCLIFSGIVNASLNIVFVIVFHMDVAGVAIATVVSNVLSSGMVFRFLLHEKEPFRIHIRQLHLNLPVAGMILKIGVPAGVQSMVFSFANVCIQAVLNGYGANAVAGSSVALNFEYVVYFVVTAFSQAVVTFTSQNFGARQFDRCKKIFKVGLAMSLLCTVCIVGIFLAGRETFIRIFTTDAEVAKYAYIRVTMLVSFQVVVSFYEISGAALRGMGRSMTPAVITVIGTCLFRLMWVYFVCARYPGYEVLISVYPISWIITSIWMVLTYMTARKRLLNE